MTLKYSKKFLCRLSVGKIIVTKTNETQFVKQKNKILIVTFYAVFTAVTWQTIFALNPNKTISQYGHNVWFKQNGLPANSVNCAIQTKEGYIWFGTSAGLYRFDGMQFKEVSTNPTDSQAQERIVSLCESQDSSLWVGTAYNGLRRYKNNEMIFYDPKDGFYQTEIKTLLESRSNNLWIGTSNGLFKITQKKFEMVPIYPNYVTSLAEDHRGRIWVGTHQGVRILSSNSPSVIFKITRANGLPNDVTTAILIDKKGNVWIGTEDGLVLWNGNVKKVYNIYNGLSNNHVTSLFQDRDNNIWVGTRGGLNRFANGKWSSYKNKDGLTHDHVISFMEDNEGSLWVCALEGLNQFMDVNITTYTTKEGLANDNISSIIEAPDHSLYFLSNSDATLTHVKNNTITVRSLPLGPAYIAKDSSLWITQNGWIFNIINDRVIQYDTTTGLPSKWISAITEDDKSLIVYVDDIGIRRFVNGRLQPYLMKDGKQYPIREYVVCFYWQPSGILWVGTTRGLVKIENGESTLFTTEDGMAGMWNSSIFDDGKGSLWISSTKGGLTRYRDGKFTAYTTKAGLFTDEIFCVLGDNYGDLWLSSPRGIGRVSIKNLNEYAEGKINKIDCRVYNTADGMKTEECFGEWQPAGWKAKNGNLWFATKKGAVEINPTTFKYNTVQPPVFIEKIIADQKLYFANNTITLQPGTEKLEFHYTALSFLVPERVLFKYKLEGFDRDWVNAKNRRTAYYTNLSPGEYTFKVMACNNDGVWNETGASVSFVLEPHFYQTFWFALIIAVVIIGIGFSIYRLRVWQLLRKEKELQARIDEAIANIKILGGLIPICASCKKIRNDHGYWDHLERYIQDHSEARFSHGICPECMAKLYPRAALKKEE